MIDYHGKTALVTGGASGIGRALAAALVARGARLVVADIDAAGAESAAAAIGNDASAIAVDLADPANPARLIEQTLARTGRIDLLCSNAGIGRNKRLMKEPLDADTDRLFAVNFFAALRLAQAYLPVLEGARMRGRMLITASENSLSVPAAVRGAGLGVYAATKHALLIMAEWLRDELAEAPLDLHVLLPGAVYTPMVARAIPDPANAPAELELITPDRCAELALRGIDLGLFYIPTQPHLATDMLPRTGGISDSLRKLGIAFDL
jgi:NAD(P)-dependent dehydrogenase (short-subunit alcohol dehydrogenase family)